MVLVFGIVWFGVVAAIDQDVAFKLGWVAE